MAYTTKTQNWKSKKLSFNSCCITCPYYGSECFSNNKSLVNQVFTLKKTKTQGQGSSNAQKKYILKTYTKKTGRKIGRVCWSYCNPPAASCSVVRERRCWFGLPESVISNSITVSLFLVTVTELKMCGTNAETVNTDTTASGGESGSYRRSSRCFNQNAHTHTKRQWNQTSYTWYQK